MKTQNSGFRNEYYYLTAIPYTLDEYKKYFQPLIKEDDKTFSDGMKNSKNNLKINLVHMLLQLYLALKTITLKIIQ
ncbi:putative lipoprotein [Staphylococcus aureus]|nr:putative lipoprotein [Staphylococcus aureus]